MRSLLFAFATLPLAACTIAQSGPGESLPEGPCRDGALGQFVGQAAGLYGYGQPAGFIASVIGAIVLLLLLRIARKGGES